MLSYLLKSTLSNVQKYDSSERSNNFYINNKPTIINDIFQINENYFMCVNNICITESFNTNISHQLCEFTALEHKFKRLFCTNTPGLNVRFKDFWYTKIYPAKIW